MKSLSMPAAFYCSAWISNNEQFTNYTGKSYTLTWNYRSHGFLLKWLDSVAGNLLNDFKCDCTFRCTLINSIKYASSIKLRNCMNITIWNDFNALKTSDLCQLMTCKKVDELDSLIRFKFALFAIRMSQKILFSHCFVC